MFVLNEVFAASFFSSSFHFLQGIVLKPVGNVLLNCAREYRRLLAHQPDLSSQRFDIELLCVLLAKENTSTLDSVIVFNKFRDGWFSWSTLPHKGHILSTFDLETKTLKYGSLGLRVLEFNILKVNISINLNLSTNILMNESLIVHHFKDLLDSTCTINNVGVTVGNSSSCVGQVCAIQNEWGQFTCA